MAQNLLIESLGLDELQLIAETSIKNEKAKRYPPYNVFKWWGRRFTSLSRALLASLVLYEGEEELLYDVLKFKNPAIVKNRAKNKLILDPFAGAGTIPIEASFLGFNGLGFDILKSAVEVANATISISSSGCTRIVRCLEKSLSRAWVEVSDIWTLNSKIIIHVFLARCDSDCIVPSLITTRKVNNKKKCLVIGESGSEWIEGEECLFYGPTTPSVTAPLEKLPPVGVIGVRAYAVEVYDGSSRKFITFRDLEWNKIYNNIYEKEKKAEKIIRRRCTPIPVKGEAARLRRYGLGCWEDLFTSRQLLSLYKFLKTADKLGCGRIARTIIASASRSASMLAVYYQPAGKVNPGLVIKGYWLPRYPVELNPLSHRRSRSGPPLPLGRGGIASHIRAAWRTCRRRASKSKAFITWGDATIRSSYPQRVDHIVTDPPYPGMQDYRDLTLLYSFWHNVPESAPNGRDKTSVIASMLRVARAVLKPGGYLVVMLGAGVNHVSNLISTIRLIAKLYGLRRIYWLPGESPGGLGRSRVRGVYVIVARNMAKHDPDALLPLLWTRDIASSVGLSNVEIEVQRSNAIFSSLYGVLREEVASIQF